MKSSEKSESELVSKSHLFENWAGQRQGSRPGEEPAQLLEMSFLRHFSVQEHFDRRHLAVHVEEVQHIELQKHQQLFERLIAVMLPELPFNPDDAIYCSVFLGHCRLRLNCSLHSPTAIVTHRGFTRLPPNVNLAPYQGQQAQEAGS